MKIEIPILVQDPDSWVKVDRNKTFKPIEGAIFERPYFDNGPQTDLVVVSDSKQAVFQAGKGKISGYQSSSGANILSESRKLIRANDQAALIGLIYSREFMLVSTFACVLRTLSVLERKNVLGRNVQWQFSPLPLICVPCRDNVGADARYDRNERKIYFGYSNPRSARDRPTYICLSREAVAHETAHAIVDGINPHLYNNGNPHAQALHESLADLTALLVALKSSTLIKYVMQMSRGSLEGENAFTRFAENLGALFYGTESDALRNFVNEEKLEEMITSAYRASTVLSGAIWDVIRTLHTPYRIKLAQTEKYRKFPDPEYSASGEPLEQLARRLRILLYRALDYLPGGEITLADYGRALILVDRIQFGPDTKIARSLEEVFLHRRIFKDQQAAAVDHDPAKYPALPAGGWPAMSRDRAALLDFVQSQRKWFGIPGNVKPDELQIEVLPEISSPGSEHEFIEVVKFRHQPVGILRVLWNIEVDNIAGGKLSRIASKRAKLIGTSVIIDCATDRILARLSNARPSTRLYPQGDIRRSRAREFKTNNRGTGLYLERCEIVRAGDENGREKLIHTSAQVVKNTIFLSGHGLSLHEDELPIVYFSSK